MINPGDQYRGILSSSNSEAVLRRGAILPSGKSVDDLLDMVARRIVQYGGPETTQGAEEFVADMHAGRVTLGTPALTNMWGADRPFASCAAVPVSAESSREEGQELAEQFYFQNMGSGYNLDASADPVDDLQRMNTHARTVQDSTLCERYVGNMAHLSAEHPRVLDFIKCKTEMSIPHFNLSVNFKEASITRLIRGQDEKVLEAMTSAAWSCGDPGWISLERFNSRNPLRDSSPYATTAPCAEVGLSPGDTCIFGYINLAAFAPTTDVAHFDFQGLADTTMSCVSVLDDLLEADAAHLANDVSRKLAGLKRRIGIGVCGFADLLVWLGIPYGSVESLTLLSNILSVVQYSAVRRSHHLAKVKGPFGSFLMSDWARGTRAMPPETEMVSSLEWSQLYGLVQRDGIRHSVLTALPPTGRSALILGSNTSIEPFLRDPRRTALVPELRRYASRQTEAVTTSAVQIPWRTHLQVLETAIAYIDESASKTVNLPQAATLDDVRSVYLESMRIGLRAMSVYRDTAA